MAASRVLGGLHGLGSTVGPFSISSYLSTNYHVCTICNVCHVCNAVYLHTTEYVDAQMLSAAGPLRREYRVTPLSDCVIATASPPPPTTP